MLENMKKISSFLECSLKSTVTTLNNTEFYGFTVTTSNKNSNQLMIDYLKSFHLLN